MSLRQPRNDSGLELNQQDCKLETMCTLQQKLRCSSPRRILHVFENHRFKN